MSLIGKKVVCNIPNEKSKTETHSGVVVEKFRDSFQHPQQGTFIYDNFMIKKEDGSVMTIHPSTIVKIEENE